MRVKILKELEKIEQELQVRILYAVESGSRAWGFASRDSDWDVRFLYIHKLDWYLQIDRKKDNRVEILPENIDLVGWELKKALRLLRKSNPPLLEWLRSPIVYHQDTSAVDKMRNLIDVYYNQKVCINHYFNIAASSFENYMTDGKMKLKKLFYILRPLLACSWLEEKNSPVPVEFRVLLDNQVKDRQIRDDINSLIEIKKAGDEKDVTINNKLINQFMVDKLNYYKTTIEKYEKSVPPGVDSLNILFKEIIKDVW